MAKQRKPIEPDHVGTTARSWWSRSTISILSLVATNLVTYTVTSYIEREKIAEARADATRAEERSAFIATWSAAELYALANTEIQRPARLAKFASNFPNTNPVAVQFLNNFREKLPLVSDRRKKVEYELAKNRIQLSPQRYQVITSFLALIDEGPNYDAATSEDKAESGWVTRMDVIRTQAKKLEQVN